MNHSDSVCTRHHALLSRFLMANLVSVIFIMIIIREQSLMFSIFQVSAKLSLRLGKHAILAQCPVLVRQI
jgi:hypothetical protein